MRCIRSIFRWLLRHIGHIALWGETLLLHLNASSYGRCVSCHMEMHHSGEVSLHGMTVWNTSSDPPQQTNRAVSEGFKKSVTEIKIEARHPSTMLTLSLLSQRLDPQLNKSTGKNSPGSTCLFHEHGKILALLMRHVVTFLPPVSMTELKKSPLEPEENRYKQLCHWHEETARTKFLS